MIISDGLAWMQRFEAINRLLGHPSGRQAAVGRCVSHIARPHQRGVRGADEPARRQQSPRCGSSRTAAAHQPDQRTQPLRRAARVHPQSPLWTLQPGAVGLLVPVVTQTLEDPRSGPTRRRWESRWYADCRPACAPTADAGLRRALGNDRMLQEVCAFGAARGLGPVADGGRPHRPRRRRRTGRAVRLPTKCCRPWSMRCSTTRCWTSACTRSTDRRLPVPVRGRERVRRRTEQTTGSQRRHPREFPAQRAAGVRRRRSEDHSWNASCLAAGIPPEVATAAVESIGHVGGVSSDRFWTSAVALHSRAWRRHRTRSSADASTGSCTPSA